MRAYQIGLQEAHNTARECLRMARQQSRYAEFWLSEAKRHFDRARWYLGWIRRGF